MIGSVVPGQEFVGLTHDEVQGALDDTNPDNPIALEIARLIEGYMENFAAHVERVGEVPAQILRAKGGSAIEEVAMQLVSDTIRNTSEGEGDD